MRPCRMTWWLVFKYFTPCEYRLLALWSPASLMSLTRLWLGQAYVDLRQTESIPNIWVNLHVLYPADYEYQSAQALHSLNIANRIYVSTVNRLTQQAQSHQHFIYYCEQNTLWFQGRWSRWIELCGGAGRARAALVGTATTHTHHALIV